MKETNTGMKPTSEKDQKPDLSCVSRRQLLTWMGAAGVAVAAGTAGVMLIRKSSSDKTTDSASSANRFKLPDHPNHNPAYRAWTTFEEDVVLWTYKQDQQFAGYRFNSNGRRIWQMCDGTRSAGEIATEYRGQTGRTTEEAATFLDKLRKLGIVVTGGYVVSAGAFPTPPEGGSYHPILSAGDPQAS